AGGHTWLAPATWSRAPAVDGAVRPAGSGSSAPSFAPLYIHAQGGGIRHARVHRGAARRNPFNASMVIAIDGPAGAGKSTVARGVARALGFPYPDSRAVYPTVGLAALGRGNPPHDRDPLRGGAPGPDLRRARPWRP